MNDAKYIGLDVHQATISIAILDSAGKLVMEAILETKTASGEICMNESSHRNSTGSETPSMRRPFDVKAHVRFVLSVVCSIQLSRLCRDPSIRTLL